MMEIRPIRTAKDHRAALAEIETLWGTPSGTQDGDQLDILLTLVENYEERRWPLNRSFDLPRLPAWKQKKKRPTG
jgi:antitoxin component HigA of HigAB toxin-antitoxin module